MEAAHAALDRGSPWFAAVFGFALAFVLRIFARVGFDSLIFHAILFVPISLTVLTVWQGRGRVGSVISREYFAVLTATLFAWDASYLLLAISSAIPALVGVGVMQVLWIRLALGIFFVALAGCCLSAALGTGIAQGIVSALVAALITQVGTVLLSGLPLVPLLASPWILYMLYMNLAPDVRFGFEGLRRRQNFRRYLEASTLNPRDADAHYQLGLLYLERRKLDDAEKRFREAVNIDKDDSDYLFQLGRILLNTGRAQEANTLLERAAKINPKTANHEVWREIGAARIALGFLPQAIEALRYYTQLREYDPQGLVFFGEALAKTGDKEGAKTAFQAAITAAQTSPSYRRHEVRSWERRAREAIGSL